MERGGIYVEHYLILARSVTYAQRMESLLTKAGIRCQIFRAPRDLSDFGCAYVLKIMPENVLAALHILRNHTLEPVKVFQVQDHAYREVVL